MSQFLFGNKTQMFNPSKAKLGKDGMREREMETEKETDVFIKTFGVMIITLI